MIQVVEELFANGAHGHTKDASSGCGVTVARDCLLHALLICLRQKFFYLILFILYSRTFVICPYGVRAPQGIMYNNIIHALYYHNLFMALSRTTQVPRSGTRRINTILDIAEAE